jgi:hypothetical protein
MLLVLDCFERVLATTRRARNQEARSTCLGPSLRARARGLQLAKCGGGSCI